MIIFDEAQGMLRIFIVCCSLIFVVIDECLKARRLTEGNDSSVMEW